MASGLLPLLQFITYSRSATDSMSAALFVLIKKLHPSEKISSLLPGKAKTSRL